MRVFEWFGRLAVHLLGQALFTRPLETGGPNHQVQHSGASECQVDLFPTSGKGLGVPKPLNSCKLQGRRCTPRGAKGWGSWLAKRVAELRREEEKRGKFLKQKSR